ncbi:MAG TPA: OsmC family protein [Acidimicrobiales bacterium]|jgi:putative redox protein
MHTVTADLTHGTAVRISTGTHTWAADEPIDAGGTDLGPNPYELLLGSLAACTAITLGMYAERKGWGLDAVSARFTYTKIHADDCATCDDDATGWLDHVTTEIFLDGDLTDEARARLADIATRCPVHKTLEHGIHFEEQVVAG